jgi:hypothetical protein
MVGRLEMSRLWKSPKGGKAAGLRKIGQEIACSWRVSVLW